ncbi:putative integral membrane protein [Sesbania bispinosa]|nr:putative integral membrane protein [Sesbania bispinosa]
MEGTGINSAEGKAENTMAMLATSYPDSSSHDISLPQAQSSSHTVPMDEDVAEETHPSPSPAKDDVAF